MARSTFKRRSTSGSVCGPEDELNTESSHARRRSNFIKQAPSDPSKRPMITLDGGGFTNTKVSRTITTIFKNMFNGSWTTWKEVNKSNRDELWAYFKKCFQWEVVTDVLVREVWEDTMKNHYPNIMLKARNESIKMARLAEAAYKEAVVAKYRPSPYTHPIFDLDLWEYCSKEEGFTPDYTSWWAHGETASRFQHEGPSSTPMEDDDVDGCTQMVMDAMGPTIFNSASFEPNSNSNPSNEQAPNPSAKGFYDMLVAADEPLWDGCQNYLKLQIVSELLNWKSENNVSEVAYNRLIPIIKKSLPPSEKLVKNFYETKKSLKTLALPEKKIHACKNHCMLFYGKKDSTLTHCQVCGHSRYKSGRLSLVPHLVLRYLPIAPRLQRLYMSKKTAKDMT
ncbi:hypothetical protein Tco_0982061 [Tanacetum coccineum]